LTPVELPALPLMPWALAKLSLPETNVTAKFAALTAENFFYTVSVAIYIMLGTAAMLGKFPVPEPISRAGIVALIIMAGVLAAAAWLAWQRPSVLSAALRRVPVPRLAQLADRVRSFEIDAYGAAGRRPKQLVTLATCEITFHTLSFIEAWFTLWLLTGASMPVSTPCMSEFRMTMFFAPSFFASARQAA
jgi:hypothetical protein